MSIQIKTGLEKIKVERDGEYVGDFSFNPTDVSLYNKLTQAQMDFSKKQLEIEKTESELANDDINGRAKCFIDTCEFFRKKIDEIFGYGTSNLMFGDTNSVEAFTSFLEGIMPYFQKVSEKRISKHTAKYTPNIPNTK